MRIDTTPANIPDGFVDKNNHAIIDSKGVRPICFPEIQAASERLGCGIIRRTENILRRLGYDTAGSHEHYRLPRPEKARQLGAAVLLVTGTVLTVSVHEPVMRISESVIEQVDSMYSEAKDSIARPIVVKN